MAHTMSKIAITLDTDLVKKLDMLIQNKRFKNRSQAIQQVMRKQLEKIEHLRLAEECSKLDVHAEQHMADEGLEEDTSTW